MSALFLFIANIAAQRAGIFPHLLSRITGSVLINMSRRPQNEGEAIPKVNIGLNLKFNKKNEEIPGYTKKDNIWLYSEKAVDLVSRFITAFPDFIERLSSNIGSDIFYKEDLFPGPDSEFLCSCLLLSLLLLLLLLLYTNNLWPKFLVLA